MRGNTRVRERHQIGLDGRQAAFAVAAALAVLAGVFLLGVWVGRQAGPRAPAAPALPQLPPPRPPPPAAARDKDPRFSFHDALVKGPSDVAPLPDPKAAPRPEPVGAGTGSALNALPPAPPAAVPATAPAPAARKEPAPPRPAAPPRTASAPAPQQGAMAAAVAKASALPAAAAGRWAVQVGASPTEAEARKIQARFAADGARLVAAEVPGKGRWYRVKLGAYETRAEAEQRLAALKARGVQGFVTDGR